MKLLTMLLGICFIFSVSTKAFACPCDKNKADKTTAGATVVADAKDAAKDDGATCACGKDHKECKGKDCSCAKDGGKSCEHGKDGKACGCDSKEKKTKS